MRVLVTILTLLLFAEGQAQFFVSPGGVVDIGKGAVVTVKNIDVENQGNIFHAGDMEVTGNIINSNVWICDSVNVNRLTLTLNWSNNLVFIPGIGCVEFNGTNQTISGSTPTNFYNVLLKGVPGNTKTMFNNVTCLNSLNLTDAELATNGNIFTLKKASISVQRNSGYISTSSNGAVKVIYPSALTGNTEVPLGYGLGLSKYKPLYLVNPSQDSFSFTLFGNSPTLDGKNVNKLQDSLCRINEKYYYKVLTFNSPLFYGITRTSAEQDYTKLGRWNGTQWVKIASSGHSNSIKSPNLSLNSQAPMLTEYISQGHEMPFVDAGPDIKVSPNTSVQLKVKGYFPEASTMQWSPDAFLSCINCPNPRFSMGSPGIYTIKVRNGFNCEAVDSIMINREGNYQAIIPNAFSPNDDNLNDQFGPFLYPGDKLVSLEIFNRWGEKIYEGSEKWDGFYMGQLVQPGVYYYQLAIAGYSIGNVTNIRSYFSGSVTVLR